jgi:hypothetical protein
MQREALFPQQSHFGSAHARARESPLSAISAYLSRSLPQDRRRACRCACRADATAPHQIHAADQPRRRHRRRSAMTHSRRHPREGSAARRSLLSFRTGLATYKDAMRNERHKHDGMHDRVEGNRAKRSGRARRPPLARTEHETSGRLPLAFGLRLKAVQIRNRALRMGRSGEDCAPIVGKNG